MADTIKVTLTPATIDAQPSVPVDIVVAIHNTGPTVEQYDLEIEGLPREWYTLPDTGIGLFPNDREVARVAIRPAQETGMGAGTHPFTVTVVARANPAERTDVSGALRVAAAAALDAQLRPSRATGRRARYTVQLRNRGNAAIDVDVDAYDSEEGCDFAFKPPLAQLKPGQRATVEMRVRPLRSRFVGPEHSFDFQVTVQPSVGEARPLQGLFIYKPRFRSWRLLTRLVSFLVFLAIVAAVVVAWPGLAARFLPTAQGVNAQANVSMDHVKLGATNPNTVAATLGKGATMTHQDTVITKPQSNGSIKARLRQGQVVAMETNSPVVKLAGGIHVGSSIADLKKTFGTALTVVGGAVAANTLVGNGGSAGAAGSSPMAGGATSASPTASGTAYVSGSSPVSGSVMTANALSGDSLVVAGTNTVDGQHPHTYFDLNKAGTNVTAIRMGVFPWITPDHGMSTTVSAITTTTTWTLADAPYFIDSAVRIPQGVTLTIAPGMHVYFTTKSASLYVDGGALHAIGGPSDPVVFTALNDQQHGAFDTLNRPAPRVAGWGGLGVTGAGGVLDLNNTEVYYGSSAPDAGNAEVYVNGGGAPTISVQNSTIEAAQGYGLNAGAAPVGTIIHGDMFNADNYPLLINGGLSLDDSNLFAPKGEVHNTHDAVFVRPGATIAANGATVTWLQHKVPFIVQGTDMVGPNGTLELGPDVIVKGFDGGSGLTINDGNLVVAGDGSHVVMMTSYHDNNQGGNSSGDGGAAKPRQGDWRGVVIEGTSQAVLHRLKMWWAGSNGRAALRIKGHASVEMSQSEVAKSAGDGISNGSDQPVTITNSLIHDNAGYGINFGGAPDARNTTALGNNKIADNNKGQYALDDNPLSVSPPVSATAPAQSSPTPGASTVTPTSVVSATSTASTGSVTPVASETSTVAVSATPTAAASVTPTVSASDTATPAATTTSTPGVSDTPTAAAAATPTAVT